MFATTSLLSICGLCLIIGAGTLASCDETRPISAPQTQQANTTFEHKLSQLEWWKKTNFYHIYLRSFKDSDGDGNGDLRGVIQELDYLKTLGVESVLMAPFYSSPMKDCGYDIDDYEAINPMFGTMHDFEDLVRELHERQMKLVVDFVPNHSSNKHKWFECSERAHLEPERCGKYEHYYVWLNSTRHEGRVPSNWISVFGGGSAWQWSEVRREFYLHQFLAEQPDLNFTHGAVREEFKRIARFWLRKGADGLRVDSAIYLIEQFELNGTVRWAPDEPANEHWRPQDDPADRLRHVHTRSLAASAALVKDWRQVAQEAEFNSASAPRVIITEAYDDIDKLIEYYGTGPDNKLADLPFNFELLKLKQLDDFYPRKIKSATLNWIGPARALGWPDEHGAMAPWIIWVTGNHDNSRLVDRVGAQNAYMYKWLSYIMPGVPVVYAGDELGIHNANFNSIPAATIAEGEPSRLPFRAPMAWTHNEPAANFSASPNPWLPPNQDYKQNNVHDLLQPNSNPKNTLRLHIKMQQLRARLLATFVFGDMIFFDAQPRHQDTNVVAIARFIRQSNSEPANSAPPNLLLLANLGIHTELVRLQAADRSHIYNTTHKPPTEGTVVLTNFDNYNESPLVFEGSFIGQLDGLPIASAQVVLIEY